MAKKHSSFDYETLVRFMLPAGILDYFEITKIDEEVTDEKDETGTVIRILHIYLDERDLRDKVWHDGGRSDGAFGQDTSEDPSEGQGSDDGLLRQHDGHCEEGVPAGRDSDRPVPHHATLRHEGA